jgi:hypothetical protein
MHLTEIGWDGTDRIYLAQDRHPLKGLCEHDNKPSGSIEFWKIFE